MYVDVESFEKWYANQIKLKKVNGEEPGKELRARSYSARDMANMLGVHDQVVYEIWRDTPFEVFYVDYWKRITKEDFDCWYAGQSEYVITENLRTTKEVEETCISAADAAELLGITRERMSSMIRKGIYSELFDTFIFDNKRWITKESFDLFLHSQDLYKIVRYEDEEIEHYIPEEERIAPDLYVTKKRSSADGRGICRNDYSLDPGRYHSL